MTIQSSLLCFLPRHCFKSLSPILQSSLLFDAYRRFLVDRGGPILIGRLVWKHLVQNRSVQHLLRLIQVCFDLCYLLLVWHQMQSSTIVSAYVLVQVYRSTRKLRFQSPTSKFPKQKAFLNGNCVFHWFVLAQLSISYFKQSPLSFRSHQVYNR